jgi:hypothetical protein
VPRRSPSPRTRGLPSRITRITYSLSPLLPRAGSSVHRLAVGLAPDDEVIAALAVGGRAKRLAHERAAAEGIAQPLSQSNARRFLIERGSNSSRS